MRLLPMMIITLTDLGLASAFSIAGGHTAAAAAPRVRSTYMEYGDNFYVGATEPLPDNVYEVAIERPLGIQFEEDGPNPGKNGVSVMDVVDGSNAAKTGKVQIGDKLVGVTAVQFVGAKYDLLRGA